MNSEEFDRLCKRAAAQDYLRIANSFPEKSQELIGKFNEMFGNGADEVRTFSNFILMAVAADGVLALEEFMLIRPLLEDITGSVIEYDDAVQLFMEKGFNNIEKFKSTLSDMKALYSRLPEDAQELVIELCLMVCAVDGRVSNDEKTWVSLLAVGSTGNESSMWDQVAKDLSQD